MSRLTIDDIIYAYHEGVEVKLCKRIPTRGDYVKARNLKGLYDSGDILVKSAYSTSVLRKTKIFLGHQ